MQLFSMGTLARRCSLLIAGAMMLGVTASAWAEPVVSGTKISSGIWTTDTSDPDYDSGARSAKAEFYVNGSSLYVELTNTSTQKARNSSHVLTGLFFDVAADVNLSEEWAYVEPGAEVFTSKYNSYDLDNWGDASKRWAFRDDLGEGEAPDCQEFGIAAASFGNVFDKHDLFGDKTYGEPGDTDYGLVPEAGLKSSFSGDDYPLIAGTTVFKLSNWNNRSLDLIRNVDFQYGWSFDGECDCTPDATTEPPTHEAIPEPATAALGMLSAAALLGITRRRRRDADA